VATLWTSGFEISPFPEFPGGNGDIPTFGPEFQAFCLCLQCIFVLSFRQRLLDYVVIKRFQPTLCTLWQIAIGQLLKKALVGLEARHIRLMIATHFG